MGLIRAAGLVAGLLLLPATVAAHTPATSPVPGAAFSARGQGAEAGEAPGGGRVLGVRLAAEVPEAGPGGEGTSPGAGPGTRIELRYRLAATEEVGRVPVRGIAYLGVTPADVRATVDGVPARVRLEPARGALLSGAVELERPLAAGDTADLVLTYRVGSAIPASERTFDVVLPLLFVDWRPAGAPEDMLRATVSIPAGYSADEVFPTVPREVTTVDDARRYSFRLQAIPSLVRLRGHAGEPPFLTFSRLVDLGVLALLMLAGGLGWWALRRSRG